MVRQLEVNVHNKLNTDFPAEIDLLEQGMDILVQYADAIIELSAFRSPTNTVDDLLKASAHDRCLNAQLMLINHSVCFLKASRLLLLTGYQIPAMSCLRTTYEAFLNAHICSKRDEQAIRFLTGKPVDKTIECDRPEQLRSELAKEIQKIFSYYSVHPNFKALEVQSHFESSIFDKAHKTAYEFFFLRNLWLFMNMEMYLIAYFVEQWPRYLFKIPSLMKTMEDLSKTSEDVHFRMEERAMKQT